MEDAERNRFLLIPPPAIFLIVQGESLNIVFIFLFLVQHIPNLRYALLHSFCELFYLMSHTFLLSTITSFGMLSSLVFFKSFTQFCFMMYGGNYKLASVVVAEGLIQAFDWKILFFILQLYMSPHDSHQCGIAGTPRSGHICTVN